MTLEKLPNFKMPNKLFCFLFIIANILIPISLLIFATGFFPHKPFLHGKARFDDLDEGYMLAAPFDKVIFMVVDALRRSGECLDIRLCNTADGPSDFVYSSNSGFRFTQKYTSLLPV